MQPFFHLTPPGDGGPRDPARAKEHPHPVFGTSTGLASAFSGASSQQWAARRPMPGAIQFGHRPLQPALDPALCPRPAPEPCPSLVAFTESLPPELITPYASAPTSVSGHPLPGLPQPSPMANFAAHASPPAPRTVPHLIPTRPQDSPPSTPVRPCPDLPPSITLLYLAQLHLGVARELAPGLITRPNLPALGTEDAEPCRRPEDPDLVQLTHTYRRHLSVAVSCLRAILSLGQTLLPSTEFDLTARCLLLDVLLKETEELDESMDIIQHGLNLARQRDSLSAFKFTLLEYQVLFETRDPKVPFRQIKKQLERCIEKTMKNGAVDPRHVMWYYRFQLLLFQLSYERAKDFPAALTVLRHLSNVAESCGHSEMWVAVKLSEAKLAMDKSQWNTAGHLLSLIVKVTDLPGDPAARPEINQTLVQTTGAPPRVLIGAHLKLYAMLLLCLHSSITGLSSSAKWWLTQVQDATDASKPGRDEMLGSCKVYLSNSRSAPHSIPDLTSSKATLSPSDPSPSLAKLIEDIDLQKRRRPSDDASSASSPYVLVSTMPRDLMCSLIYILGLAVHFDGYGKSPKCLAYAMEGVKQIDRQLRGGLSSFHAPENTSTLCGHVTVSHLGLSKSNLDVLSDLKIEASLLMAQLAIIRSDFDHGDQLLLEVIRIARQRNRWDSLCARIALVKGVLSQATGNIQLARQSFLASLFLATRPLSSDQCQPISLSEEVGQLAKASYVLTRLAQDHTIDTHGGGKEVDTGKLLRLDLLTKELALAAEGSLPNVNIAIQVVLAIKCGEIVRAKHHLTIALNDANKTSNTHMKTILLALLSNMFLNTRSDQAFKMLHSCFKLTTGFRSENSQVKGADAVGLESLVGHAQLGLWAGRKLLEIYELRGDEVKTKKQLALNQAHESVLRRQSSWLA